MQELSDGTLLQGGKYRIEKMLLRPLKRFRGRISCLQKEGTFTHIEQPNRVALYV